MFNPVASINSLTYFYQDVLRDTPGYLSMESNWYSRKVVKNLLKVAFVGETQTQYAEAIKNFEAGDFAKAETTLQKIVAENPAQVACRFYLAKTLNKQGKSDAALDQVQACIKAGWNHRGVIENDEAFATLKGDARFSKLLKDCPNTLYGNLPTRGFRSRHFWSPNGSVNSTSQGQQFVLSTVLATTSGRGSTLNQAIEQLERSAAADHTHPQGTFFFSKNGDVRTKAREQQYIIAMSELQKMGFKTEVIRADLPSNRINVLGVTLGKAELDWVRSRSKFVPGALCDNLTSSGGRMQVNAKQTPCTHFLASGAAGASGTVTEPLAIPNKFPHSRLHVHYVRGCTLAESYYQAVQSPFQLLIVGDPLCKPWANKLEFSASGIEQGQTLTSDNFELTISGTDDSDDIEAFELYVDGLLAAAIEPDKPTKIQLDKIPDGYHELRMVAVANNLIASRTSQSLGFQVDRKGQSVSLKASGNGSYQLSRSLPLSVESTIGDSIDIYQNSRKIGTVQGKSGELIVDCKDLGQGPTTLYAIVKTAETRIVSEPVAIEIVP